MNNRFFLFYFLVMFAMISFTSCKKDVEGCTDPTADNYNPEATVSTACKFTGCTDPEAENYDEKANVSGDCVYARDKFIGAFSGQLSCPTILSLISGMTEFTIDENLAGGKNDVTIVIETNTGLLIPVTGTCAGDVVSINATIKNVDVPVNGQTVKADVTAIGNATLSSDGKTLSGPLTITAANVLFTFSDNCTITGTRI